MKKRLIYLCLVFTLIAMTACRNLESKESFSSKSMEEYSEVEDLGESIPEKPQLKGLGITPEKLQAHIEEADKVLKDLKEVLESDEANPEEKFAARITYKSVLQQRESWLNEKRAIEKKLAESVK